MTDADASLPLQKAIIAALKADAAVVNLVAQRIFDGVPVNAQKPYLSLGTFQVLPDQGDCYDASDTTIQINGWSTGPSSVEAKKIGRAVRSALDQKQLVLDENQRLVSLISEQSFYMLEVDGITQHAVLTFIASTEPIT